MLRIVLARLVQYNVLIPRLMRSICFAILKKCSLRQCILSSKNATHLLNGSTLFQHTVHTSNNYQCYWDLLSYASKIQVQHKWLSALFPRLEHPVVKPINQNPSLRLLHITWCLWSWHETILKFHQCYTRNRSCGRAMKRDPSPSPSPSLQQPRKQKVPKLLLQRHALDRLLQKLQSGQRPSTHWLLSSVTRALHWQPRWFCCHLWWHRQPQLQQLQLHLIEPRISQHLLHPSSCESCPHPTKLHSSISQLELISRSYATWHKGPLHLFPSCPSWSSLVVPHTRWWSSLGLYWQS